MFGIDMLLDSMGINPDEIKGQIKSIVETAAEMRAAQIRIEAQNAEILGYLRPSPVAVAEIAHNAESI